MKLRFRNPFLVLTLGMLILHFNGYCQPIVLNNTMTPAQYVQNVLLGPGNVVTNITYNGSAAAANTVQNNVASFTSSGGFTMSGGLLMTTNVATDAIGPNNSASEGGAPGPDVSGDADLTLLAGGAVTSGAIIEFDFVAGTGFSFSYIFASEEYPEWAPPNASVNDVFGFFLSGPGIAGGQGYVNNAMNIARLPNNTQVSIDNVNPVTNTAFYVNNAGGAGWGTSIEYDGTTTLLTANPTLVCGTTYHMKLAVANTSDDAWGSAVFIQSGSFVTGSSISAGPNQAVCTTTIATIQLAGLLSSITNPVWSTSGSGTFSSPSSPTATYTPSAADIAAGSVTITYTGNGLCSALPLTSTMTLTFLNPTVTVSPASTTHCIPGTAVNLTGTATSSAATVPRTFTSTATSSIPQNATGTNNIIPVSGITPATLGANPIVNVTVNITHPVSRELEIRLISPSNQSIVLAPANAGFFGATAGANYTNTVFTANAAHPLITTGAPPYSGNWRPQTPFSTLTGNINGNWRLVVIDNYSGFLNNTTNGVLNSWSITFNTDNQIVSTVWTPATNLSSTTTLNTVATPMTSTTYTLTATDATGCTASAQATITINPSVTPTFNAVPAICSGTPAPVLPTTSNNGITGTWSPAVSNTASGTYTFTPAAGQCASTTTLNVTVNTPTIVPAFAAIPAICAGDPAPVLPTTSTNGITGTWSPAVSNTASGTYTFTPNAGQCAVTTTLNVTVNPSTTPTFTAVAPICSGAAVPVLPTTSNNGFTGTWSPAVSNTATGTYTFSPTAGQCATIATLNITVNPQTTPTFNAVAAICSGAAAPVLPTTSTNSITGTWSPAVSNTASGTYTFTPNAGQCATTTTLSVTVNPLPVVTVNSPTTCPNTNIVLDGNGAVNYTWSPATGLSATIGEQVTANLTSNASYTVVGTDANGCQSSAVSNVNIAANLTLSVNPAAPTICQGDAVTLTASGATNYTWTPAASLNVSNVATVSASPAATTTYTVNGESNGCTGSATVTVTVGPPVTPTFNGVGPFCAGTTVTPMSATSLQGITGTWSPALNNASTTTYTFTPSTGQCANQATAIIAINPPSPSQFNPLPPICIDGVAPLLPAQDINGITGTWSPSTINNQSSATYVFTPTSGQCATQGSVNSVIMPNPVASFSASDMELETVSTLVNFQNGSSNATTYDWTFSDGGTSSVEHPSHTFPGEPGGYTITLTATNDLGCWDETSMTISIKEDIYVFVPNSFTPDGDEFNNEFKAMISGDFDPHNFTMYIFNRWGELIFESHDPEIGWDGTYHDVLVKDGAYTWKLDVKLKSRDDRRNYVGSVTMIK